MNPYAQTPRSELPPWIGVDGLPRSPINFESDRFGGPKIPGQIFHAIADGPGFYEGELLVCVRRELFATQSEWGETYGFVTASRRDVFLSAQDAWVYLQRFDPERFSPLAAEYRYRSRMDLRLDIQRGVFDSAFKPRPSEGLRLIRG